MNILIITPRVPYPPFRGDKLKIYNIAKHLSVHHSVRILTFLRSKKQLKDLEHFNKYGIQIDTVKLSISESLIKVFIAIVSNIPFQVAWYSSSKMKSKINEILRNNKIDVVYYHLIRSAQYLSTISNERTLKVIDYTDAVSLYLKRFAEIENNPFKKFFIKIEQKRVAAYESIAEKFHTLFICSKVDKDFLEKRGIDVKIQILQNGIDTKYFNPVKQDYNKDRIIFTGNMPYYANYDAAIYFAQEIFPLILKSVPKAEFFIVGQKPPVCIRKLQSGNIKVTGFVPDIKAEYLKSALNVAPMRFGAGTLNKVIESISLGVPVVATSLAIEGLPEELYKYIFVADNKNEFAGIIIKILNNPSIRNEFMEEGKNVICNLLSWEKIVDDFANYLESELSKLNN